MKANVVKIFRMFNENKEPVFTYLWNIYDGEKFICNSKIFHSEIECANELEWFKNNFSKDIEIGRIETQIPIL